MKCFFNGQMIDRDAARVSVFDLGFTMGVAVTEQIRTYQRRLPLLERHLRRLFGGLELIGLPSPFSQNELTAQITALIKANGNGLEAGDELGVGVCITPGRINALGIVNDGPTTLVYSYPLTANQQRQTIQQGVRLATVATTEIPASSVPKALKCRSRIHYYLAEQEARAIDSQSRALLLDTQGHIAEGTTASVIMVVDDQIVAPPKESVLPSVTLDHALELANDISITVQRRPITPEELQNAHEIMWLSTPVGIVPVTHLNKTPIGSVPQTTIGPVTQRLIDAWHENLNPPG